MSIAEKLATIAENEHKVFDAGKTEGKQTEYDRFWDAFQDNGNRTQYENGFSGHGWNNDTFKPKYNMQPTTCYMMFRNAQITELWKILDNLGVTLDTSKSTNFQYTFYNFQLLADGSSWNAGVIDMSSAIFTNYAIYGNWVKKVEKLVVSETTVFSNQTFQYAPKLVEMPVEGTIAMDIWMNALTALNHDSLLSVINALKDYSGTSTTKTLTIGSTNKAKLTTEELDKAINKGWTVN